MTRVLTCFNKYLKVKFEIIGFLHGQGISSGFFSIERVYIT